MEYGINIRFFENPLGIKKAAEFVAKAGFTALNYTPPVTSENWKDVMKEALKIFEDNGLFVHQTHALFNRYGAYGDKHTLYVDRCAEATQIMGAKFMVVHGDEFDYNNLSFSPETALAYNHNYFLPYVEQAEQNGYKVAFETVFDDVKGRRYTSKADELMDLIVSYKSESAVCCWDFGHAYVSFHSQAPDVIRKFGKLIQCTHLHDNTGTDSHQMPMTGDINWKETMDAFRQIGYNGVMSVEYSHGRIPESLAQDFINLTYQATKYIWGL